MKQEQVAMHVKKLNIPRLNLKKLWKWSICEMIRNYRSTEKLREQIVVFQGFCSNFLSPRQRQVADVVTHSFNY